MRHVTRIDMSPVKCKFIEKCIPRSDVTGDLNNISMCVSVRGRGRVGMGQRESARARESVCVCVFVRVRPCE